VYDVTIITPAAAPITAPELRARLRLNDDSEDDALAEFLTTAVEMFEDEANRPVLATAYRQTFDKWPCEIVLGRGGVTEVTAVKRYLADSSTEDVAADQWLAILTTPPARVALAAPPALVTTAAGIVVAPVGCVEFTAGWADADAVPKQVVTALKLMAGFLYEHREAHTELKLSELPYGWRRVVSRYKLGISGDWGQ
jgi:uncharacterized phiE125 gp8 family phage protein